MKQLYQQYPKLEQELERQGRKKAWLARHLKNRKGKPMSRNDLSNRLSGYHNMQLNDNDREIIAKLLGVSEQEIF